MYEGWGSVFKWAPCFFPDGQLSEASKKTLEHQGGKMNAQEVARFDNNPLRDLIISMRGWDEKVGPLFSFIS